MFEQLNIYLTLYIGPLTLIGPNLNKTKVAPTHNISIIKLKQGVH